MNDITQRKFEHLALCTRENVGFRKKSALFECVMLQHDSLPELDFDSIDLSCQLLGKRLRAPILIAAMTGGNERAYRVNRELASIAEEKGYAFGFGSQRPILENPTALRSYQVRDVAPNALVLGNIGVVQACQMSWLEVQQLVELVHADALCVHMNPAMELVQADGDRDFRFNLTKLEELSEYLSVPVVAKETGCGVSSKVARRLREHGIRHVDVSGAGGTSWVGVEYHRAMDARKPLARTFWDWGIPTAASVALCVSEGMDTVVATGGIATGLDVAKAIALGASAAGIARPILQAFEAGGRERVAALMERIETELRMAMLLVGVANLDALRRVPRIVTEPLEQWLRSG